MKTVGAWYGSELKDYDPSDVLDTSQFEQVYEIPGWWDSALQRIVYLLSLPDNWDTYGASAVKRQTAFYAVQILQQISRPGVPAPSIVPTVGGSLQFEWHTYGIDLEFEVVSPTHIYASFEDHVSGQEWEKHLDYNLLPIAEVVKQLVVRQVADKQAA